MLATSVESHINNVRNQLNNTKRSNVRVRNIEGRSRNHFCRRISVNIAYSERVFVALVIQHAKRMRRIILPSVVSLVPPYFSTLSHTGTIFVKILLNIKLVSWFSLQMLSKIFSVLRTVKQDFITSVHRFSWKVPAVLKIIAGALQENVFTFFTTSCPVILRMRNVSNKSCR
jgi:hypothetical protein